MSYRPAAGLTGSILLLLVASVIEAQERTAAGQQRPGELQDLCQLPECSCTDTNVTCSCTGANQLSVQRLTLGGVNGSTLPSEAARLQIRNCHRVTIHRQQQNSRTPALVQVAIEDVQELQLTGHAFRGYRRLQTIQLRNIANLSAEESGIEPDGFLILLQMDNVTMTAMSKVVFGKETEMDNFTLANSTIANMEMAIERVESFTMTECNIGDLHLNIRKNLHTEITGNRIGNISALRISDNGVYYTQNRTGFRLAGNNISGMTSDNVKITADTYEMSNNTIENLTAAMDVSFKVADIINNTIGVLGDRMLEKFYHLPAGLSPRFRDTRHDLTFASNLILAPTHASFGRFLTSAANVTVEFHIYANSFDCQCETLQQLVRLGHDQLQLLNRRLLQRRTTIKDEVYGALLVTSGCHESNATLEEFYRQSYNTDLRCLAPSKPQSASAAPTPTQSDWLICVIAAVVYRLVV